MEAVMSGSYPYYRGERPEPSIPAQPRQVRRLTDWQMIGLVFAGSFICAFFMWPLVRPAFVHDTPPAYAEQQPAPASYPGHPQQRHGGRR
jgi:hypothetical protein